VKVEPDGHMPEPDGSASGATEQEASSDSLVARLEALTDGRTLDQLDPATVAAMDAVVAEHAPLARTRPNRPAETPPVRRQDVSRREARAAAALKSKVAAGVAARTPDEQRLRWSEVVNLSAAYIALRRRYRGRRRLVMRVRIRPRGIPARRRVTFRRLRARSPGRKRRRRNPADLEAAA
jgi:hypothetical protein